MTIDKFSHVKISCLSVVVPPNEINIFDEAQYYDNNIRQIERMKRKVGFYKRRVVDTDTCAEDLAFASAKNLIEDNKIDKNSIDALIYVYQQMAYPGVIDAYELHHKLVLSSDCIATGILQGCAGWLYGLYLCSMLIESGAHKKILLLNADTPSKGKDLADRNSAPLFGDGGCATLLEYTKENHDSYYNIASFSDGYDKIITPGHGSRLYYDFRQSADSAFNAPIIEPFTSKAGYKTRLTDGQLDGNAVFEFTINKVPLQIKETMEYLGLKPEDFSQLCLHQANKQIVQSIAKIVQFPLEKTDSEPFSIYGNNTMCSIPTVLSCQHQKNGKFEDKPYLCCAFGNGLVSVTAVLDLKNCRCSVIKDFEKGEDFKTREQWIEYWKEKFGQQ